MLNLSVKKTDLIARIIFLLLAIIVVATFRDYGITWDEELQSQYGLAVVDYYASFFKDHRFDEIFNLYLYGGMFDGLASLIDSYTPLNVYETRHLINALFGMLGLWGTYRLGKLVGDGVTGLIALILLTLTPMYYGHMFNNPKDIPFAAGIIWSIYYMARIYPRGVNARRSSLVKLGVVYGLTLGIRVGGVMLFAFWMVPWAWDFCQMVVRGKSAINIRHAIRVGFERLSYVALPVFILSYGVMLVCWPWAQEHPLLNPLRALSEFSNFPQDVEVLLDGTIYRSTQLPWTYVPLYFGIQLPAFLLLALLFTPIKIREILHGMSVFQRQALTLIVLMIFVPIAYAVIRHPALYDAVRHFLFAVPLACVLASLTLRKLATSRAGRNEFLFPAVFAICMSAQIVDMIRLHPYEYIYANALAGDVKGAYGKYEMDYWGSSFKEAAADLQAYVAKEGGVPSGKIYRIAICGPWDSAMIYLPPDFRPVVANEPAEFFLSTTRWMCQNMRPGKEIIRVERLGVPLSIIKDLRNDGKNP